MLSPRRPKKRDFKFTKDVISQIGNTLTVEKNGKVKFKHEKKRSVAPTPLLTLDGKQENEGYQNNEEDET